MSKTSEDRMFWEHGMGGREQSSLKSFPEEVALNFRTKATQGRESGGGPVIQRLEMQAGPEDHELYSVRHGKQLEGQLQNPICPQTQLSLHPASTRLERSGVM